MSVNEKHYTQMYRALQRIKNYQSPERLHKSSERYGIGGNEAIEMAYENVLQEAKEGPVWTGSCPCQPLSSAGQRKGHADRRHLWPSFFSLIAQRGPAIIFGEQVASADGLEWLAGIRADLEDSGYAVGAADLCAASTGAPQVRQRLYWVAYADSSDKNERPSSRQQSLHDQNDGNSAWMGGAEGQPQPGAAQSQNGNGRLQAPLQYDVAAGRSGCPDYQEFEIVECLDGIRRIEPGAQPLVNGVPARLDKLRGYGNAIHPRLGAEFIAAATEVTLQP